jgi:hypothetical protein
MSVFIRLCNGCNCMTGRRAIKFVRPSLKIVMKNYRDFVNVILLHSVILT